MRPAYTDGELERVRAVIAGGGDFDSAGADAQLFRKLQADPLLPAYSFYGFFPGIYQRIYGDGQRPQVSFAGRSRGRVAFFRFDDGSGVAVKPWQSRREATIAQIASEEGVGPHQFPSLAGFLTEDLIDGTFFTDLAPETLTREGQYQVGWALGRMLVQLHRRHICYNDATLSDPEGRSHLIVSAGLAATESSAESADGPGCRLIDFGVSVLLDNHPNLEPEEVYNLARTTPEFRLASRLGLDGSSLCGFLEQYRQRLAAVSREEIMARDLRFFEEGLAQAAHRLGETIIEPVRSGFAAGYG